MVAGKTLRILTLLALALLFTTTAYASLPADCTVAALTSPPANTVRVMYLSSATSAHATLSTLISTILLYSSSGTSFILTHFQPF